ncbi:hypothetical protein [Actinacidiphila acidipaludis]|uniref:Uncharacterized protein n=1 Tax=Actinacidiphila acidipaludis TaxID=2873382 RepID=A0ABS7Q290_9ACTN|nr:hypothetical protein [Streptomyces acidipaludis]MBY8877252.1 hypothetical protein [Streptomyces acidipaludis]
MTSAESAGEADFWPFLISRGRRSGFQVVAAPDFLCDAGLVDLLWETAGGSPMAPGQARRRAVKGTAVGDFAVLFRVRLAEAADLGAEGDRPRDEHGRPVPVVEGVVERAAQAGTVTDDVLGRGAEECAGHLREFWRADLAWPGPAPTCSFHVRRTGPGRPLDWELLEERRVAPRPVPPSAGGERAPASPETGPPKAEARAAAGRRRAYAALGGAGMAVAAVIAWAVGSRNR